MKKKKLNSGFLFVCFLVGAVGIIIFKQHHVNQVFVTAFPVAIMLIYALSHLKEKHLLGRVGDNLYYLGFLYTLVSLGVSLFEFSLIDESSGKITQIITNFGIAIASTIFGIFFRVFFNQSEEDEAPKEEVSESVSDFREQVSILNSELGEFSEFRTELEQILRESADRQKTAISQFKASVTRFTKTVEESRDQLQVNLDSFVNTVSDLNTQVSNLDSALKASSDAVSASIGAIQTISESVAESDVVNKINSLQVPEDLLEQLLRPSIQNLEIGAEQISKAGEKLANRLNSVQIPQEILSPEISMNQQEPHTSSSRFGAWLARFGAWLARRDGKS